MARITYFPVMVFVIVMLVTMEAGEADDSFDCYGPVRKRASATCRAYTTSPQLQDPPGACCMAYRTLTESVKTRAERRQLCSCIQQLANDHELHRDAPVNLVNLDALWEKCGIPYMYSSYPSFDCNTVN